MGNLYFQGPFKGELHFIIGNIIFFTMLFLFFYNFYKQSKIEEKSVTYLRGIVATKQQESTNKYRVDIAMNGFNYIYYASKEIYTSLVPSEEIDFQAIGNEIVKVEGKAS